MAKIRKLPDILTKDEQAALLSQFNKRYPTSNRNRLMILFALQTGCRISELINLQWSDVTPEENKVHLKHTKGSRHRIIFINNNLISELQTLSESFSGMSGLIFTTLKGDMLKDSYLRKMIHDKAIKAGIEKRVHFHLLRHSYLTERYTDTKDIRLVQEIAGHSDISTTMIYTHISGADVKKAMIGE